MLEQSNWDETEAANFAAVSDPLCEPGIHGPLTSFLDSKIIGFSL
jgi:hypothetical protein